MIGKIRASKYRHIVGKDEQLRNSYGNINLGSVSPDADFLRANTSFFAIPWAIRGSLCVVPLKNTGSVDREDLPLILQDEEQAINSFAFHPFNNNLIVTGSQDGKAYLWRVPDEGLTEHLREPEKSYTGHPSRILLTDFHPFVNDIFYTTGADKTVRFWNVETGQEALCLRDHKDVPSSFTWNADGSLLASYAKDKKLRVLDPRAQATVGEVQAHEGTKGARAIWLANYNKILTAGFTRQSEREIKLWDPAALSRPLVTQKLDVSSSLIMPFYDPDSSVLYLAGKGDGLIRIFEVVDEAPYLHALVEHKSSKPQTGLALLPKTSVNVMECEIARFLKLSPRDVVPLTFSVPRMNKDIYQDDLYPDTWDGHPTAAADEWLAGANNAPNKISLRPANAF
jgi:coronin-1B/1C/6